LGCPVRAGCLEYALANDERFGIWGGLSERERRRLKPPRTPEPIAAARDICGTTSGYSQHRKRGEPTCDACRAAYRAAARRRQRQAAP
jgi:WhiB family transcriptional regulator, redox-sensing transcriptional regulator